MRSCRCVWLQYAMAWHGLVGRFWVWQQVAGLWLHADSSPHLCFQWRGTSRQRTSCLYLGGFWFYMPIHCWTLLLLCFCCGIDILRGKSQSIQPFFQNLAFPFHVFYILVKIMLQRSIQDRLGRIAVGVRVISSKLRGHGIAFR